MTEDYTSLLFWEKFLDTNIKVVIITNNEFTTIGKIRKIYFSMLPINRDKDLIYRVKVLCSSVVHPYINSRWHMDVTTEEITYFREYNTWLVEEISKL